MVPWVGDKTYACNKHSMVVSSNQTRLQKILCGWIMIFVTSPSSRQQ